MMNDSVYDHLRELSWRRKLTTSEELQLRAWLAAHPEAQADWEDEARLNEMLGLLPDAPVARKRHDRAEARLVPVRLAAARTVAVSPSLLVHRAHRRAEVPALHPHAEFQLQHQAFFQQLLQPADHQQLVLRLLRPPGFRPEQPQPPQRAIHAGPHPRRPRARRFQSRAG